MRWGHTKAEVKGFGINYTVPFAHAYRVAKQLGIPHEQAIDHDVYHFARLGFDAYRVHVWDTEISDSLGNLLSNEHLRLFDYTLKKMKERGMKFIITPIAYWGNGWPEPDEKTPGFSRKYGKGPSLTNPDAIKAQETYLYQFLNHVNTYTGIAYKDDPDIIAFEISNEPHHNEAPQQVTGFINRMVAAMRRSGTCKPIFYNISHSIHLADAYFNANIQGGTFQWYPTGLGARHELRGNLLANVDEYTIPFANNPKFKKMAKIVYEFDAADVGRSYIYPAMAREFREAGLQVATHFSYDPTYMAYANTEYDTHYMNLVYAPQKALSLMIASEVFHRVPLYKDYGPYPANTSFDAFRVSYEQDLAEMVTDAKFIYTNHTTTTPPAVARLAQIAGFGNSPVVTYEGRGAYFLDRLEAGVWRLEVLPDAIWVRDPFGRNSLKKEVAVVNWRSWPMSINLPDLGDDYRIVPLNDGNTLSATVTGKRFTVAPGTYLLVRKGTTTQLTGNSRWRNLTLKEFAAPVSTVKRTYVLHRPVPEVSVGQPVSLSATVVTVNEPEAIELVVTETRSRPEVIRMDRSNGYTYTATLPERVVNEGFLRYYITVKENGGYRTYPSGLETRPSDWDFYDPQAYSMRVVPRTAPVYLFEAATDTDELVRPWTPGSGLMPTEGPGKAEVRLPVEKLVVPDPENRDGARTYDYSFRYNFAPKVDGRRQDLASMQRLVIQGRSLLDKPEKLQVALVTKEGSAYGGLLTLEPKTGDYTLPLKDLKPVKVVSLPRPYPSFLPYYFDKPASGSLDLSAIESLQFSIGPGLPQSERDGKHGVAISSVRLE
ncbi:hypothetical protein GCM10023189_35420 [Nibrella saemangeumensis]|uniref:Glycoside hydrolase family 5 domain-containing protein n=2 Tax=Nibrella saemangeumensis TaxID=1084526 RepID=A0ABP8N4Q3_9BACT